MCKQNWTKRLVSGDSPKSTISTLSNTNASDNLSFYFYLNFFILKKRFLCKHDIWGGMLFEGTRYCIQASVKENLAKEVLCVFID